MESSCPTLNKLCQKYLDHFQQVTDKYGADYHYFSYYRQNKIGLYDYQRKEDQGLIRIRDILIRHLKSYNKEHDFVCVLTVEDCERVSSIYYSCFSNIMESDKSLMMKYSNWWDKKCLKFGVFMAPLTSVHDSEQVIIYSKHGDYASLSFEESYRRKRIIHQEHDQVSILENIVREIEYWKELENFWVFLGSSVPRDSHSQFLLRLLSIQELERMISSFIFQRDESYDQINFYKCYRLSHQLFTGFLRTDKGIDDNQLAILVKDLGDRKTRKQFPRSWKKDPQTTRYLARQTMCLDKGRVQDKLQTLEQFYSGTV